ncbi:hypothetical protein M569_00259 [Genlisea aurea]|uniref:Uncharacterized protein n=1 Tax=Genlisea aurea TaxID=192259 RepID=S8EES9_9LAMI|nr:hypothetical protein M569_00259 [Genlisea aurea]
MLLYSASADERAMADCFLHFQEIRCDPRNRENPDKDGWELHSAFWEEVGKKGVWGDGLSFTVSLESWGESSLQVERRVKNGNSGALETNGIHIETRIRKGRKNACGGKPVLDGYTDADMASDVDFRKSASRMCITFSREAVSWQSKLLKCLALSTKDTEYRANKEESEDLVAEMGEEKRFKNGILLKLLKKAAESVRVIQNLTL